MSKPLIVVTGKNGQLGSELQLLAPLFVAAYDFLFVDRSQLDLSSNDSKTSFNSMLVFLNSGLFEVELEAKIHPTYFDVFV